jgi:indole-3-glycerol phosphate synthase
MKAEAQDGVLAGILAATARRVEAGRAHLDQWERRAAAAPMPLSLAAALRGPTVGVIGEVKRRSPSAGHIHQGPAAQLASLYQRAGAAGVSVLTEPEYFHGSLNDLEQVVKAVSVPVLRKDFVIDPVQIYEARAAGASAVLLIARILVKAQLAKLAGLAAEVGLEALAEVHDERELDAAAHAGSALIGVNARDLDTLAMDPARVERLLPLVPAGVVRVAESGIASREDVVRVAAAGADAVLVGTAVAGAGDPGEALKRLVGVKKGERGEVSGTGER